MRRELPSRTGRGKGLKGDQQLQSGCPSVADPPSAGTSPAAFPLAVTGAAASKGTRCKSAPAVWATARSTTAARSTPVCQDGAGVAHGESRLGSRAALADRPVAKLQLCYQMSRQGRRIMVWVAPLIQPVFPLLCARCLGDDLARFRQ